MAQEYSTANRSCDNDPAIRVYIKIGWPNPQKNNFLKPTENEPFCNKLEYSKNILKLKMKHIIYL